MEGLKDLLNDIGTHLPKLSKSQLVPVLTQLCINTVGKPEVIYDKRKLMHGFRKAMKTSWGMRREIYKGKLIT